MLNITDFVDEFIQSLKDNTDVDFSLIEFEDENGDDVTVDPEQETRDNLELLATELFHHNTKDIVPKSSDFVMTASEAENQVIIADASSGILTVTLPAASETTGKSITVKKIDNANNVNVASSDNIDGQPSLALVSQYDVIEVVSDGSTYHVMFVN